MFGAESPEKARHRLIERSRFLKRQGEKQGALIRRKDRSRLAPRLDAMPQRAGRAAVARDPFEPAQVQAEELADAGPDPLRQNRHLRGEDAAQAAPPGLQPLR